MKAERPFVADESVDVMLSNCVLNLVRPEDKGQLFEPIAFPAFWRDSSLDALVAVGSALHQGQKAQGPLTGKERMR